ncbi:hypothetical protein CBS11852_1982 [Aspergillus niger]|nr:hypothetical protein CBS11350_4162 [Aspergillus niger]KAI2902846.1 hypothetical protein CBS11852_1982 [Aspergillus niger]
MVSRLVCPLCGSFLDQDRLRNVPNPSHWGIRLWSTEVRGLYAVDDDTGRIAVTGVGVIRNHNILHASVDQDQAYFDVADFNALDLWVIRDFSVNRGCFAFHDSCWNLLLSRLRQGNAFIDDATILRSVFDQLYYSPAPEAPGPEDSSQYFGFADPCGIFSLDQLESIRRDERGTIPPRGMEPGSDDERHLRHNTWIQVKSHWVGNPDIKGRARGILSIPGGKEPYYLLAGLDRFKIVALGFGEVAKPYKHAPKPLHSSAANTLPSRADSHLWMPPVSLHMSSFISPLLPCRASGPFNPLLNFDFGGRRGLRLRDLTTLEFHLRFHRHPLVGMVARYSHGNVVKCGVVGENVMSFFLDSSNGERITQIRVLRDNRYHTRAVRLVGLEVSTNYGRTATFAPLFHRLNASVRTISGVPPRHTITGIVVQPAAYRKYFEQLRIHSQFCIALPASPHNLDRECHRVPEDQIQYDLMLHHNSSEKNDMKCYQTYASLKGVRTITASTGNTHYSRSRHWITGLKIEYYNHPSPNVVGQWIRPLHGEVLELDPGEEIKSITVWVGFDSFISQFPELSTGNIAAIWIDAGMHRARFSTPIFQSGAVIQSQYLRDADKELTAISWVVSAESDRVRAVMSPYGSQRSRTLMPTLSPPYDRVRKLYFKRQDGSSRGRKIVKAEACIYGDEISGLRFTYQSRNQAAVGDTRSGMTRQVVEFSNTDIIMGLSVKTSGTALLKIQFEVERDGTQRCLSLGIPNDQRSQCDRHLYWGDIPANVETAGDIFEQEPIDKIYKPPKDSKLIGIYVDCDCISEIGAIYEPERSQ